ncbi:hypothetical protein OVY29_11070 [Sphingopyxis sp. SE2]|uniref:hypothetical protein n=1 Tax=Sphingopyxis sp. SE2 TaxID=1586240 RepID=UPI0028C10117|nr:hypothetical protein [Sphingopyxis sp. SE2]MDT7529206.1 hypothetical protein [Sphingopyxis sp. SE2]
MAIARFRVDDHPPRRHNSWDRAHKSGQLGERNLRHGAFTLGLQFERTFEADHGSVVAQPLAIANRNTPPDASLHAALISSAPRA